VFNAASDSLAMQSKMRDAIIILRIILVQWSVNFPYKFSKLSNTASVYR